MTSNSLKLAFALAVCIGQTAFASDCAAPGKTVSFSHGEAEGVVFISGPSLGIHEYGIKDLGAQCHAAVARSADEAAMEHWFLERNGTVFWSQDSKRLLLRDEYAADDTENPRFLFGGL